MSATLTGKIAITYGRLRQRHRGFGRHRFCYLRVIVSRGCNGCRALWRT
jgi:hypothetical protein